MAGDFLPSTGGEVLGAGFASDTAINLVARQAEIEESETGDFAGVGQAQLPLPGGINLPLPFFVPRFNESAEPVVDPEKLNEQFQGVPGLKFEKPTRASTAKIIADGRKAQLIRDDIIARGPGGVTGTAALLAGGLLGAAVDPLELATAFVPVVGEARLAGLIARQGRVLGRVSAGVIEGGIGNIITEPLFATLSIQQQLDYGMSDALLNLSVGAMLGAGGGLVRGLRAPSLDAPFSTTPARAPLPEGVERIPPQQRVEAFKQALAQAAQGRSVDMAGIVRPRGEAGEFAAHAPGRARRPQTITEFIAMNGGIRDDSSQFRGEIASRGNPNVRFAGKLSRDTSTRDLDDFAEIAAEQGFISKRDVGELLAAIDDDLGGRPRVRNADANALAAIREGKAAQVEADRQLSEFEATEAELRAVGIDDATPEEIQQIGEIMRRDRIGAEDAFERMAIENEGSIARSIAARESDLSRDFSADPDASREIDAMIAEEFDVLSEDIADLNDTLAQMRERGELDERTEAAAAEANNMINERATAFADVARAAATCFAGFA